MDTDTLFLQASDILKPFTRWSKQERADLMTVSVSRTDLLGAIQALLDAKWGYLSAITGLHIPGVENKTSEEKQWDRLSGDNIHTIPPSLGDSFLILYHFCRDNVTLNLRVHPPSIKDASVPSVCGIIPSATLYERELVELFGITVTDTPDTTHLLLPEDWPDGVYPLRKDFTGLPAEPEK